MTKRNVNTLEVHKLLLFVTGILFLLLYLTSCQKSSYNDSEIIREFSGVATIDITTVSGSVKIIKSNDPQVKVFLTHHYEPLNTFKPILKQNEDVLTLRENMLGSNSGSSEWILNIPVNINIVVESASGSISLENVSGKIKVVTASGDIIAKGIKLNEKSEFISSSGDVDIKLSESPAVDVLVSSASGSAILDYNNNRIVGTIVMKARFAEGSIICPYEFDSEKEKLFESQKYIVKSVSLEDEFPNIKINTASGDAVLKN